MHEINETVTSIVWKHTVKINNPHPYFLSAHQMGTNKKNVKFNFEHIRLLYPHIYVCILAFLELFIVAYYCMVFYRPALYYWICTTDSILYVQNLLNSFFLSIFHDNNIAISDTKPLKKYLRVKKTYKNFIPSLSEEAAK